MNFAVVMAILVATVLVLVAGLEAIDQGQKRRASAEDPEKVLAARFARGEIDEAEYSRRLTILRLGPPLELPD